MPNTLCVQKLVSLRLLESAVVSGYLLIQFLFHETLSASSLTHVSFYRPQHRVDKDSTNKFSVKNHPGLSVLDLLYVSIVCCL